MSNDSSDSCLAVLCASCCVIIATSLQQWCNIHALGADCNCCGGPRGCCNSCFESSLNEDNFEKQLKEDTERREAAVRRLQVVDAQPAPTEDMNSESSPGKPVPVK
ncbi:hypothetical protein P692DRAFT_20819235 [Suillus brevipes Sb2]|nr:hypothetical protein P692DRAFT_20819235 [Suillus brevipes Sb2]